MVSEETLIRETWSQYWHTHGDEVDTWDALSETVLRAVERELGVVKGRRVLEGGCGTGRISAQLAKRGARVTCLDIAPEALILAEKNFDGLAGAKFVPGSILSIPRGDKFDAVWNAGVIEHFNEADQQLAISEFIAVLADGGKVLILTPYARSLPYRMAKFLLEKRGKWPYGREIPITTMAPVMPPNSKLVREYTVSFLPFFLDCYKFVPILRPLCRGLTRAALRLLGGAGFAAVDRMLSRVFGGYLLVSVVAPAK